MRAYILQQLRDTLTKEQFKQHPQIRTYFGGIVKVIIQRSRPQKRNNWSVNFISMFSHWSHILTKNITCSVFIIHAMVINLSWKTLNCSTSFFSLWWVQLISPFMLFLPPLPHQPLRQFSPYCLRRSQYPHAKVLFPGDECSPMSFSLTTHKKEHKTQRKNKWPLCK